MIIFDLDGTLWDTTKITYISANKIASMHDDVVSIRLKMEWDLVFKKT